MRVAMETQQVESNALKEILTARDQLIAELQNASPVVLAGELRELSIVLSRRAGRGNDDVVDGKGVRQPPRLANRTDDFAEWTHKTETFVRGKPGDNLTSLLKWAQQQRKTLLRIRGRRKGRFHIIPYLVMALA